MMSTDAVYDAFGDQPTCWTVIRRASASTPDAGSEQAWRELIERYREPVRLAVRRRLLKHPHADEIAADFFAYLYEKRILLKVDPKQGQFRCFIQGVIRNYVKHALRTGGSYPRGAVSGEVEDGVSVGEPTELEQVEEAEWAEAVLGNAIGKLRRNSPRDAELLLRRYGIPPYDPTSRADLAREFQLTSNAVDQAVHRSRARLKILVVKEAQQTVNSAADLRIEFDMISHRLVEAHPGLWTDSA